MASQLRTVLDRLSAVNDNLRRLAADQAEVVQVARLWQDHHDEAGGDEPYLPPPPRSPPRSPAATGPAESSLHVFSRPRQAEE